MAAVTKTWALHLLDSRLAQLWPLCPVGIPGQLRRGPLLDALLGDRHLNDCGVGGDIIHDLIHDLLQNGPQAAGSNFPGHRPVGHGLQGLGGKLQFHLVIGQQSLILLHQGVLGLGQNTHHLVPVQRLQGGDHRHTAHQLRDDTVLQQVLGLELCHHLAHIALLLALNLGPKAQRALIQPVLDDLVDAVEGAAADKEDIVGVNLDKFLMGVLPSALGGHIGYRALQNLQQRLLHALAGHVPGNGRVFALPGNFIHLVDIDNPPLRQLDVVVGGLDQAQEDILHVITHIARLGKGRGVGDGKGHPQHPGQGFSAAGGPHQKNVALLQLHILRPAEIDALIVVVHRHGQGHLGLLLTNNILVQHGVDFLGGGDRVWNLPHKRLAVLLLEAIHSHGLHAKAHTLVTDINARARDHPLHLVLVLAAEGTAYSSLVVDCHEYTSLTGTD